MQEAIYASFNTQRFLDDIEKVLSERGRTWTYVLRQCNIYHTPLYRMRQIAHPSIQNMAALATWAGLSRDSYVVVEQSIL